MTTCFVHTDAPHYFVHLPRTGGTSFCDWLGDSCEPVGQRVHTSSKWIRDQITAGKLPEAPIFGVVRNPWDRAVSQFHHDQKHSGFGYEAEYLRYSIDEFDGWLESEALPCFESEEYSAFQMLCDSTTGEQIAAAVRFEDFIKLYGSYMGHRHKIDRAHRTGEYFRHDEAVEIVRKAHQWDIDRYGFEWMREAA